MKLPAVFVATLMILAAIPHLVAQQNLGAVLQLKIAAEKDVYAPGETVWVQVAFKNVSARKMCFPEPSQNVLFAPTGSLIVSGRPPSENAEIGPHPTLHLIRRIDGRGKYGRELDEAIRNEWVKLDPGKEYLTKKINVIPVLDESGQWRITASYEAPEGSFDRNYKTTLRVAAEKAGCILPEGVTAEPKIITVRATPPETRR